MAPKKTLKPITLSLQCVRCGSAFTVTGIALKISPPFTFTTVPCSPGSPAGFVVCVMLTNNSEVCLPIDADRERERDGAKDVKECVVVAAVIYNV